LLVEFGILGDDKELVGKTAAELPPEAVAAKK
jgi:hypothetical protein